MENKIKLTLMGLSYTPMQDGAFALLLEAEGTNKRIPVIIGAAEAQAIAIVIENINPQRPMTHDLFATMTHAFGISLSEVFIYRFEDGIFSAEMTFTDGDRTITLDSRTSDAVAIALRTGAPIYTTRDIVDRTGIELVETSSSEMTDNENQSENTDELEEVLFESAEGEYDDMDADELYEALNRAIDNDDFEEAAIIRRIIDERFPDKQE